MSLENVIDTLLNVWVFAFIGILIWLYFKKNSDGNIAGGQERNRDTSVQNLFVKDSVVTIAKNSFEDKQTKLHITPTNRYF